MPPYMPIVAIQVETLIPMLLQDQDAVEGGAGRLKRVVSLNTIVVSIYECSFITLQQYYSELPQAYSYTDERR
jgi:hypothetical protein